MIEAWKTKLGTDYPDASINNLAAVYSKQSRWEGAEAMFKWALECHKKVLGPDNTSTLNIVGNLGVLYTNQGQHKEAEARYNRRRKATKSP